MIYNDCDDVRELVPAYVLGATDPEETRLIEMALADCPELLDDLAEYATLTEAMHLAVALRHDAPPADRILAPLRQSGRAYKAATSDRSHPETRAPWRRAWWFAMAALFVVTVLAVGSNILWYTQTRDLQRAQQALQASQMRFPTPGQSVLPAILKPENSQHRRLTATAAGQPGAQAQVLWNSGIDVGAMMATGLAQLPPDMAYQLWVEREDETISLGQFQVDADGAGFLLFQSPEAITRFSALGISPEPASGSAQPTHDPIAVGKI